VRWQERLGDSTYLYMDGEADQDGLVVRAAGRMAAQPGQRVAISLPADELHVFDAQGQALTRTVNLQDHWLASA